MDSSGKKQKCVLFHINYLLTGGIETVLIELLNALDEKRYRVILSLGYYLEELEVLKEKVPAHVEIRYLLDNPKLTRFKKKKILHRINVPEKLVEEVILPYFKKRVYRKRLKEVLKDVDVLVDFDMTLAPFHDIMAGKQKVAYCHFSLKHYWDGKKSKVDRLAKRLAGYDKVIMLCDEMKEDAVLMYPFLKEKLVRIYNAVNQEMIRQKAQEPIMSTVIPGSYIISVGRLNETQKDFTTLINGYAGCTRKYAIKEKLVIVGEGQDRENLMRLAKKQGIADMVIFTGFQSNPYNWMSAAKAFVFCTKYEGLPTVLIEAHTLGKPVIATSSPTGIKELLMHGKAGILVQPGNSDELSEAIYSILQDNELQQKFAENVKILLEQFDIRKVINEFERLVLS